MSAERLVTRTFKLTKASVKVLNKETQSEEIVVVTLTQHFKSESTFEKTVKKSVEKDGTKKYLYITAFSKEEVQRAMKMEDFYEMSFELPTKSNEN